MDVIKNNYFWSPNLELQSKINEYFSELFLKNSQFFDNNLSIILLGSLSRGEASWALSQEGQPYMVSDIEFFTIYPDGFSGFDKFNKVLEDAKNRVFGLENSDLFHIDNTYIRLSSLPHMERKVLTYDAKHMGITVMGKDYIPLLPDITIHNINKEDIFDVMIHRIFSVMYFGYKLKSKELFEDYRYSLAKNSLDLMTVILAANGKIASGFINKLNEIEELDIEDNIKVYFRYCLDIKLGRITSANFSISEMEKMFVLILDMCRYSFSVGFINRMINFKVILRRHLGMIKRGYKTKTFSMGRTSYLSDMISSFKNGIPLSRKQILENFVLNGYPEI